MTVELPKMTWQQFLEKTPPQHPVEVQGLQGTKESACLLDLPDVDLYCEGECQDKRRFHCNDQPFLKPTEATDDFILYHCRNCMRGFWTFALRLARVSSEDETRYRAVKFGQIPPFGPRVPPRLQKLIKEDRELFFKGRQCESHGLGIGAFTYYRRVVENQKDRLFDEIIKVAKAGEAPEEEITALEDARSQFQFGREVAEFKDLIPEQVKLKGHNPLTLLHDALSVGVHSLTDDECLERACDVRTLLTELANRVASALQKTKELDATISRLNSRRRPQRDGQ